MPRLERLRVECETHVYQLSDDVMDCFLQLRGLKRVIFIGNIDRARAARLEILMKRPEACGFSGLLEHQTRAFAAATRGKRILVPTDG